jgi:AraC-like DNA-binding protein
MNLKKSDREALLEVKLYIEDHYRDDISIRTLSEISGLNAIRLQKAFKELFLNTIYAYCKELRRKRAAFLLSNTDMSVKQVALEVGYRKTKSLTTMFKSYYGETPTEYRLRYIA